MGGAEEWAKKDIGDGFAKERIGSQRAFAWTGAGECEPALEAAEDAALFRVGFVLVCYSIEFGVVGKDEGGSCLLLIADLAGALVEVRVCV